MSQDNPARNRLADETSPYLLQHRHNPVDWYPWCDDALERARQQDKPILLSIGYSACHWCHVMAHESFEDEETARLMNQHFINIKVDREERPDLDKIYQLAHQMLTGRGGGWPLTIFLSPKDQVPFFAGTYFPPQDRYGLRSFRSILGAISEAYASKRLEIEQQNDTIRNELQKLSAPSSHRAEITETVHLGFAQQLLPEFDKKYGGFTPKPKFPHAYFIERCLRLYHFYGDQYRELLEAGLFSAKKMAQGGLFDQVGGGFCRYSTDEQWMIPHFEKMLYDNGQLMPIYIWANQLSPDPYFERAITLTADWLMREMQSPEGGYYSAQDADSEGIEGKYYTWQPEQVDGLLTEAEANLFKPTYGFDRSANFEGVWYPHLFNDAPHLSAKTGMTEDDIHKTLEQARLKLLNTRSQRIKPGTDDKILTSWNALMIRGMLIAGRTLDRPEYIESALRSLEFIHDKLWRDDRLLATYNDEKARLNAYLDDYSYLLLAIIEALQTRWNNQWFEWARKLADSLIKHFASTDGGSYFTSDDHQQLIMRSKTFHDDAMPSGNAIAAQALYYLGYLCSEPRYIDHAEATIQAASLNLAKQPISHAALLNAVDIKLRSAKLIILRGDKQKMQAWEQELQQRYLPDVLCVAIDDETTPPSPISNKKLIGNQVSAYICEGMTCQEPVTKLNEFRERIKDYDSLRIDPND